MTFVCLFYEQYTNGTGLGVRFTAQRTTIRSNLLQIAQSKTLKYNRNNWLFFFLLTTTARHVLSFIFHSLMLFSESQSPKQISKLVMTNLDQIRRTSRLLKFQVQTRTIRRTTRLLLRPREQIRQNGGQRGARGTLLFYSGALYWCFDSAWQKRSFMGKTSEGRSKRLDWALKAGRRGGVWHDD